MDYLNIIKTNFSYSACFTEEDLFRVIGNNDLKISTLRWALYNLEKGNYIHKVGRKTYTLSRLIEFEYDIENIKVLGEISDFRKAYPNINITLWDSNIFNKWFNLILLKNIYFIEVDPFFVDYAFSFFNEENKGNVLIEPSYDEYIRYGKDDCIIIKKRLSKSPLIKNSYKIAIEKLAVDMLFDKFLNKVFDSNELVNAFNEIIRYYRYNFSTMLSYASRRNKDNEILKIIRENNSNDFNKNFIERLYKENK